MFYLTESFYKVSFVDISNDKYTEIFDLFRKIKKNISFPFSFFNEIKKKTKPSLKNILFLIAFNFFKKTVRSLKLFIHFS